MRRLRPPLAKLLFSAAAVALTSGFIASLWRQQHPSAQVAPSIAADPVQDAAQPAESARLAIVPAPTGLADQLAAIAAAHPQTKLGVAATNLRTGETYAYQADQAVTAASTIKIVVAADYLQGVEEGRYSLDDPVAGIPAQEQLRSMVQQSDNDAWAAFNGILTYAGEEAYGRKLGLASYRAAPNEISPKDMAAFLGQLWAGTLLNAEHTQQLLGFMRNTSLESLIPDVLPEGATVYHKFGRLDDHLHDAAIVVHGDAVYALAAYTQGDPLNEYDRVAVIHEVARAVDAALAP